MNNQSSNGQRRIVSASQASSQQRSDSKHQSNSSRQGSKRMSNMSVRNADDSKAENLVTEGLLPNIKSSRFSQTSKVGLHSHRASEKLLDSRDQPLQEKKSLKSFQLAEQFQAEDIIQQSQRNQDAEPGGRGRETEEKPEAFQSQRSVENMKELDQEDVEVKSVHSTHPSLRPPGASIDFHGVGSRQLAGPASNGRQSAQSGSRKGSQRLSASAAKKTEGSGQISTRPMRPVKKVNAWETFEVNQFKVRNQEPGEFINKLKLLTAHRIPFMGELPPESEMDSTDPLDSFIDAFHKIMTDKSIDYTPEVRKGIHLATGTRTEFCEQLLTFVCHHQKLEQAFVDAVEFFMESLTSVVKLEEDSKSMTQNISHLLGLKEDGIVAKYNLEKRLKDQQNQVEKITLQEKQSQNKIKQLQQQLQDRIAENDSLEYRLKHYEEITGMMEPPGQTVTTPAAASGGAVPNPAEEDKHNRKLERTAQGGASATSLENSRIKDLQSINKRLEEELQQVREAATEKDNSDHYRKIQELFNKIQIENKNLRIYNQKCESKLESKQNLVGHLEDKVTAVMVDKEEIVIKLKSEIVLLKNKLELNEEKFKSKLEMQKKRLEHEFKTRYDDKIKDLEGQVSDLDKQRKDLRKRLTRLHKEHEELSQEFTSFRREKEEQESQRNRQFKALEDKIAKQILQDDERRQQSNRQVEGLENQNEVIQKENNILLLRQKYLKQQTETLAKQKIFLFETLGKGKSEIQENLQRMENAMMADNNNQAYLVSVEKCIKQAKRMADMGTAALSNISQILQFLKIEKLHQLLSDEDELEQLEKNIIQSMNEDFDEQRAALQDQAQRSSLQKAPGSLRADNEGNAQGALSSGLMIQRFLNKHGLGDTPAMTASPLSAAAGNAETQSKQPGSLGSAPSQLVQQHLARDKTEEYYLNHCPVELASICVKLLVDILVQIGMCSSVADVPQQVSQLLLQCNKKSDQTVEKEILGRFFSSTKSIIEKQIAELRSSQPSNKDLPVISDKQKQQIQEQLLGPSAVDLGDVRDTEVVASKLSDVRKPADEGEHQPSAEQAREVGRSSEAQLEAEQLKLELQQLKLKLEEQKMKSRNLQLNLAGKIVVLEEQIEQINQEREDQIQQLEKTHQEELQRITSGVEQRETQLLQLCDEYREEVRDLRFKLETSWKPAEESKTVQKMEKGTRGNLYRLMKDEYERLFHKNEELLHNYQASINEFVYLREDLRGSFTLAFDCERLDEGLLNMLNEAMLKYYLSKTFVLDKSKFRFLRSEQLSEKKRNEDEDSRTTQIMKIIIEVVAEDQGRVSQLFKNVKAQIKDGTSLLYDFMPLYFGMNLGSSGFSTHHNLKDFALLSKIGQIIDGEEYVVSVMRNKHKPLVFKIIAFNLELREEFMMELSESDIYELVEGDQQVLKNLEPDSLIKKITTNLNLIVRDKIKVLTCEQKIFFNEIWMQNMESGKNNQVHVRSPMETQWPAGDADSNQQHPPMQSFLTHTAARTSQLSQLQRKHVAPPQAYLDKFSHSVGSQTDYEMSTLYEGFENVYRGVQKVGEITHMRLSIQEATKTRTLVFTFDDLTSLKKLKFSLYEKAADADQYVVHSECMRITDGHHVLVSVEQIQQQGLLIKMYDMLECKSVNFSLLRKPNGQFTRLSEDSSLDILMKDKRGGKPNEEDLEAFRNFIYELTFVVNKQANENLMQSMQYLFREDPRGAAKKSSQQMMEDLEQKKQMESLKRENAFKQASGKILPRRKRALYATRVYSFSQKAFFKEKWSYLAPSSQKAEGLAGIHGEALDPRASPVVAKYSSHGEQDANAAVPSDWRDTPGEKGTLLYRNTFVVRCIFNGAEETTQQSMITLYLKDLNVNIEVSLGSEQPKMSIASSVHALDLFGDDPLVIPFKERVSLLNGMMEKFFIISEDSVYHMKVESDAMPVQLYLEEKKKEAILRNPKENKAQEYDVILTAQKIREIQDEKEQYLASEKALRYSRFADIDGEVHEVEVLFIKKAKLKTEKAGGRHSKKGSSYGKSQMERVQMNIEQFLDEQCDWDSIYFEIVDQHKETVSALYDRKKLSMMLSKDEFFDWRSAMTQVDPYLLDYIKRSIKVDKLKGEVSLHNKENIEQNIFRKYRKAIGGKYLTRTDLQLNADENKIVEKQMISNCEIEMSEYLYDIKIYQIQKHSDKDIIAYQIEIFTLNDDAEEDVVYMYNYPMNFSTETQDPHSLVIDVLNLVEHPFKTAPQSKKGKLSGKASAAGLGGGQYSKSAKESVSPGTGAQSLDFDGAQGTLSQQQKAANKRTTSQELFRKYIDNRVLLFIQESRFPRKLDFILAEPCSQFQWRYHIEPRQITTGMASMHLADQATLEMFVSVLLDENEHCVPGDQKLYEYEGTNASQAGMAIIQSIVSGNWAAIEEVSEQAIFLDGCAIPGCDMQLSIRKQREAFLVEVQKSRTAEQLAAFGEQGIDALQIHIDPLAGDTQLAKVLKEDGLDNTLLLIKVTGVSTTIKVVKLAPTSIKTLFKFVFVDEREVDAGSDDERARADGASHPIFTARDLQATTVDVLRRYYGAQTMEQAMRMWENQKLLIEIDNDDEYEAPTIFEQMAAAKPSVHKTRMLTKYVQSLDTRTVVLHRKTFYDDEHEQLILMQVQLQYVQKDYQDLQFRQDVDAFNVVLQEQSGEKTMYITPIYQCFTPEELQYATENGQLRDMGHLKQLSKKFLEERVEIRRNIDDDHQNDASKISSQGNSNKAEDQILGNYSLHINFGRDRIQTPHENMEDMDIDDGGGMQQDFEYQESPNFYQEQHNYDNQSPNMQNINVAQFQQSIIYEEEMSNEEEDQQKKTQQLPERDENELIDRMTFNQM